MEARLNCPKGPPRHCATLLLIAYWFCTSDAPCSKDVISTLIRGPPSCQAHVTNSLQAGKGPELHWLLMVCSAART